MIQTLQLSFTFWRYKYILWFLDTITSVRTDLPLGEIFIILKSVFNSYLSKNNQISTLIIFLEKISRMHQIDSTLSEVHHQMAKWLAQQPDKAL